MIGRLLTEQGDQHGKAGATGLGLRATDVDRVDVRHELVSDPRRETRVDAPGRLEVIEHHAGRRQVAGIALLMVIEATGLGIVDTAHVDDDVRAFDRRRVPGPHETRGGVEKHADESDCGDVVRVERTVMRSDEQRHAAQTLIRKYARRS